MQVHDLVQGSDAWDNFRLQHYGASEAAPMLGLSKKVKRSELLHMKHTGSAKEFSEWVQKNILDYGHEVEAMARPLVEQMIGEDLYPVTCSDGMLSASCDGLTLAGDIAFEHKQYNTELATSVSAGVLPDEYMPQCQQIMLVTGAKTVIFVVSDGTTENMVHMSVYPDAEWQKRIIAGWEQFRADLQAYAPPPALPAIVAEPVQALPAVLVQVTGEIAIKDNFKTFEIALRDFLEHRLIREPKTDQDFADLDQQIKAMKGAELALESAEAQMLAQIQAVDTAKKAKDMLAALVRDNRLMAEKLLAREKERRRAEIVSNGITALREHCSALTERIGKPYLPTITADFAGAIKGMRSLASMEDAIATTLANSKIEANAVADRIQVNLAKLRELASDHAFLFADTAQIVLKAPEDCQAVITARIAEHKAAEEKRLADERERIAAEERAKAEAAIAAQQRMLDQAEDNAIMSPQAGSAQALQEQQKPAGDAGAAKNSRSSAVPQAISIQPAVDTGARIKLGDISIRLGFAVTAEFLASLGFQPVSTERGGKWYRAVDFPTICAAIIRHVEFVSQEPAKAA